MRERSKIMWLCRDPHEGASVELHSLRPKLVEGRQWLAHKTWEPHESATDAPEMVFCQWEFVRATGLRLKPGDLVKIRVNVLRAERGGDVIYRGE